ncbi:MAG: NADAR family protein [bacterium]|nr:NADAR family protein [bacterium]
MADGRCHLRLKWICAALIWLGASGCSGLGGEAAVRGHGDPRSRYPSHWWAVVSEAEAASWEVLPQEAGPGEVILSKRNELGLLSNFTETPFVFRGRQYRSLEGFWQMMKYPEDAADPRAAFPGLVWKHRREDVARMGGFEAKAAGRLASVNMRTMAIDWVTFEGQRLPYRTAEKGAHYDLIVAATREKVRQNPRVRNVLLSTGDLTLRPDHHQPPDAPPAWRYYDILMMIREEEPEVIDRHPPVRATKHPA